MAIAIVVTPGRVFQEGEEVDYAKLNQLGTPVIQIDGAFGPSDMAAGDYSSVLSAGAYFYGVDTGVANAAQVTLPASFSAYDDGMLVAFKVKVTNTGPVTLAVNGLAARPVLKNGNVPMEAGDWKAGQIVSVRYRLDASIVPAAAVYSGGGSYVLAGLVVGTTYAWTPSNNDVSLQCGATTLVVAGSFTATAVTATLTGLPSTGVTCTVIPASNVWQMLSQLGNLPARFSPFIGSSAFSAGLPGAVPAPNVGQQNLFLRGDATWVDAVALATAAASAQVGNQYIEVMKSLSFC